MLSTFYYPYQVNNLYFFHFRLSLRSLHLYPFTYRIEEKVCLIKTAIFKGKYSIILKDVFVLIVYSMHFRRVIQAFLKYSEVFSALKNDSTLLIVNSSCSIDRVISAEARLNEDRGVGAYNRRTLDIVDDRRRGGIRAVHNCQCIVDINLVARSYRK